jgi:hypothetical protein
MATIVHLDHYRKPRRCDAERFRLYATGTVHCAQCGALMRNISVVEGEEGRAGSK